MIALSVLIFGGMVILTSWVWPVLPAHVPLHINTRGVVDAYQQKNIWAVFGLVLVTALIGLMIAFAYAHPEYTNLPTTKRWKDFPPGARQIIIMVIRHFLTMVLLWATMLIACLQLDLLVVSLGGSSATLLALATALGGLLLITVGVYSLWLSRWINQLEQQIDKK